MICMFVLRLMLILSSLSVQLAPAAVWSKIQRPSVTRVPPQAPHHSPPHTATSFVHTCDALLALRHPCHRVLPDLWPAADKQSTGQWKRADIHLPLPTAAVHTDSMLPPTDRLLIKLFQTEQQEKLQITITKLKEIKLTWDEEKLGKEKRQTLAF